MTPEYYANQYRQFQQFCKDYGDNKLFKIACGPNGDDTAWTEKLMSMINPMIAGAISLHFYTIPTGNWNDKGNATGFSEELYHRTIRETRRISPIIESHLAVMDRYDPEHRIGLCVDEWGCWYNVEEGTNPGFLYQQNTMRDAIVASVNLNIFNNRADRIVMANIAQVVNVLQSVILTEGPKMLKTPTYHVFSMYKDHQGSTLVESKLEDTFVKHEGGDFAEVSVSASVKGNSLTVTLANASLENAYRLDSTLDAAYACWTGRILTDNVRAFNSFDNPNEVTDAAFRDCVLEDKKFTVTLPPCSVVTLTFTK
jgi:alpha-N-arabinofuranosidase